MSDFADFQEVFIMLFAPAVSIILAFSLAGAVVIAVVRVVVRALSPRARRVFVNPEWGIDERR